MGRYKPENAVLYDGTPGSASLTVPNRRHGISEALWTLAEDEGRESAICVAQTWQLVLEDICEAGTHHERVLAQGLLVRVNDTINEILCLPRDWQPKRGPLASVVHLLQRGAFWICCRVPYGPPWPLWWVRMWERIAIATTPVDGF